MRFEEDKDSIASKRKEEVSRIEFSVSQLSARIRLILEKEIGLVHVKGEISGLKIAASGHAYFNLKDEGGVLACTAWRSAMPHLRSHLAEGAEVVCCGKITSYAGQSRYQMNVQSIRPAGIGAMMKILQERKSRLQAEGLFDEARKKTLPFIPRLIGVVTSPSGAVIRDIIHRLSDRLPAEIVIWPALVQGDDAARQVKEGVDKFNQLESERRPDLIIVARGGGSIEDLWPFNDEDLVRSIAQSKIPVISAVGHETDFTLADFAADKRAPTPTAAAEFAVPVRKQLACTVDSHMRSILSNMMRRVDYRELVIKGFINSFSRFASSIMQKNQKLDEVWFLTQKILPEIIFKHQLKADKYCTMLAAPQKIIEQKNTRLQSLASSHASSSVKYFDQLSHKFEMQESLLQSLNYKNVLKRGYVIVKNSKNKIVPRKSAIKENDSLSLEFFDGSKPISVSSPHPSDKNS